MAGIVSFPGAQIPHVRAVQPGGQISLAWAAAHDEEITMHEHQTHNHHHQVRASSSSFESMFRGPSSSATATGATAPATTTNISFGGATTATFNGVAMATDMMEQIRSTKAQLDALTKGARDVRMQQHHSSGSNNNNNLNTSSTTSTFQHLDERDNFIIGGKLSPSWDIAGAAGGASPIPAASASSPSRDLYGSLSPMSPQAANGVAHQKQQHYSISPLRSPGGPNLVSPDLNKSNGSQGSNNNNNGAASSSRPPWNYRAGKAVIAKDADPAAAVVTTTISAGGEHDKSSSSSPSAAVVATNDDSNKNKNSKTNSQRSRFDTPDRVKLMQQQQQKKQATKTDAAVESNEAINSKKPRTASVSSARATPNRNGATNNTNTNNKKVSPVVGSNTNNNNNTNSSKPTSQKSVGSGVTARTFFPSPLRDTSTVVVTNGDNKKPVATATQQKEEPAAKKPSTTATPTPASTSTPRGASPAIAAAFGRGSKGNNHTPKRIDEDFVNSAVTAAVSALEKRLQRQEIELATLRHEHSALQLAHNTLKGQHTDLVDFVRLQLDELRAASDVGVGSCCGRSDTTEGTQRALAMIDAEIAGSTPPLGVRARMTASQQQQQIINASSTGAVSNISKISLRAAASQHGVGSSPSPSSASAAASPNRDSPAKRGKISSTSIISRPPPSAPLHLVQQ